MPTPYRDRLVAICRMLNDPSHEVVREGYDLLFDLWLENADFPNFDQVIIPLAIGHEGVLQELETRLDEEIRRDSITDIFLRKRLEIIASEVSKRRLDKLQDNAQSKSVITSGEKGLTTKAPWWKNLFLVAAIFIVLLFGTINFIQARENAILVIAIVVIFLFGVVDLMYIFPRNNRTLSKDQISLNLNYKSPTYISLHDENKIEISIENPSQTVFKGIIILVFDDPDSSIIPAVDQKFYTEFDMHCLAKESRQFKFRLTKKPSRQNLSYHFQISRPDGTQHVTDNDMFLIAPIPYLRTASKWLFGTLATLVIPLLWERIKKALGIG